MKRWVHYLPLVCYALAVLIAWIVICNYLIDLIPQHHTSSCAP